MHGPSSLLKHLQRIRGHFYHLEFKDQSVKMVVHKYTRVKNPGGMVAQVFDKIQTN
jgi:hypothetical protein